MFSIAVVSALCFLSLYLVNTVTGQSQACINAEVALNQNSECQQAFMSFNIETDTGDGPLCSGTCRNLLDNIASNCPHRAVSRITYVYMHAHYIYVDFLIYTGSYRIDTQPCLY